MNGDKPVLFIAAEPREYAGLLRHCRATRPLPLPVHWARAAECQNRLVWLVANGAGQQRAAAAVEAALAVAAPACVVSTGFCGGLDPALRLADIFIADQVNCGDNIYSAMYPESADPAMRGSLVTVDRIALVAKDKRKLRETGASVVEMEAAGAANAAAKHGLRFFCVRSVSDLAEENFVNDYNAALRADGRFDTIKILSFAMRRPLAGVPELFRLRNRCILASARLGEFLAKCRF
jgi:adenosylhomocysteine nucleosidase